MKYKARSEKSWNGAIKTNYTLPAVSSSLKQILIFTLAFVNHRLFFRDTSCWEEVEPGPSPAANCKMPGTLRVLQGWTAVKVVSLYLHNHPQPQPRIAFSHQCDDDRNRFTFQRFIFLNTETNTKIVFYKETISLSKSCSVNLFASCWSTKYVNPSSDGGSMKLTSVGRERSSISNTFGCVTSTSRERWTALNMVRCTFLSSEYKPNMRQNQFYVADQHLQTALNQSEEDAHKKTTSIPLFSIPGSG